MRRVFTYFGWWEAQGPRPCTWSLSDAQRDELQKLLSEIGLQIVAETRGPVPLMSFGRRMLRHLSKDQDSAIPPEEFATALKGLLREMQHEQLRVMAPSDFPGVGYVYNLADRETWPVRSSR